MSSWESASRKIINNFKGSDFATLNKAELDVMNEEASKIFEAARENINKITEVIETNMAAESEKHKQEFDTAENTFYLIFVIIAATVILSLFYFSRRSRYM